MNKNDYNKIFESVINKDVGKRVLLHACCAPCASGCLERFSGINAEILYFNPNISPQKEYKRREDELTKLCKITGVPLRRGDYSIEEFAVFMSGFARGESDLERKKSGRCAACILFRLQKTAEIAKANNFDYFCTTLTISPHKDCGLINELGYKIAEKTQIAYLPADFKKRGGYLRSVEKCAEYGIYRQSYCGCSPRD